MVAFCSTCSKEIRLIGNRWCATPGLGNQEIWICPASGEKHIPKGMTHA